jgi:N utilization substance protein A
MVVNELRGEKVDIVPYSDDASEFVMKALAPARVREVRIHPDTGTAEVIVPDFQLSLAIGKEGQNARLAARLTGWRVDIKSETQLAEEEAGGGYAEGEWVEGSDGQLMWQPAEGGEAISAAEAGYGTIGGDGAPTLAPETKDAATVAPETKDASAVAPETEDVDDEEPQGAPAEEAALHVDDGAADEAADELAADTDLDAETDTTVEAEEEAIIEETAGDES